VFPLGGTAIPPEFADAVDEFKEAVSLARRQRYVESIGRCRRVLEALDEPPFGPPPTHQEWADRTNWSWRSRLAFMCQGLRHTLHAGPHRLDGDEPRREDTQMMLNMVGSLLRFVIRNESAGF
jgi:hypothetical protein